MILNSQWEMKHVEEPANIHPVFEPDSSKKNNLSVKSELTNTLQSVTISP